MLPARPATPATRDDVPARMSGTGRAESPLGSCPTSLEHPSISSNTSTCLLECGRLCSPCCSMDSGILHLRADAGATEPRRRAINEQQALAHHLTRDSAQSGPTTSRTRRLAPLCTMINYGMLFNCSSHNRDTSTQIAHRTVAQSGHNAVTWGCWWWGEGGTPASVLHGPRCGRVDSYSPAQAAVSSPPLWGLCELSVHTSVHLERRGAVARFRPSREGHRLAEQPADAGGRTACAGRERHWRA